MMVIRQQTSNNSRKILAFFTCLASCTISVSSWVITPTTPVRTGSEFSLMSIIGNVHVQEKKMKEKNDNRKTVWSNDEFQDWFYQELVEEAGPVLHGTYGDELFVKLSQCVTKWRQRYQLGIHQETVDDDQVDHRIASEGVDGGLWKRLFKRDRVVKEVIESIPIVHAIDNYVRTLPPMDKDCKMQQKITILDLCSGKGYLSMILSEYLPPDKVEKLVLVDKAWPMCHAEPKPHHMNWDHIYGNYTIAVADSLAINESDGNIEAEVETQSYFTTWPIPLHTSKQNLKSASTIRQLQKRLGRSMNGPIFVLGVHLCGTLSIQAVQMFYSIPNIHGLILKPCCLPGMAHEKQQTHFQAGKYAFPTKEVCAPGYWKKKLWEGPPRWHLEGKFNAWCRHLYEAMKHDSLDVGVETKLMKAPVQTSGGFQNTFLFAQKEPRTEPMWDAIEESEMKLKQLQESV